MKKLAIAAMLLIAGWLISGCSCTNVHRGAFGRIVYKDCKMGCLEGRSCGCSKDCSCHARGCRGQ